MDEPYPRRRLIHCNKILHLQKKRRRLPIQVIGHLPRDRGKSVIQNVTGGTAPQLGRSFKTFFFVKKSLRKKCSQTGSAGKQPVALLSRQDSARSTMPVKAPFKIIPPLICADRSAFLVKKFRGNSKTCNKTLH